MVNFEIVRAKKSDAQALTELAFFSKASNGYDDAFMEQCREELTFDASSIAAGETWVATEGDDRRILGFVDLHVGKEQAEIHAIFVAPQCKRSGVGSALWDTAEQRARQQNAERIELDSDPVAVAFYEAKGMSVCGQSPSGSIPGRMLPRMGKDLT